MAGLGVEPDGCANHYTTCSLSKHTDLQWLNPLYLFPCKTKSSDSYQFCMSVSQQEKYGLNVCGEGGEYETFTLDCPLFNKRIVMYVLLVYPPNYIGQYEI